jgi:HJR/Mrr/RecB family endonuclease
MTPAVNRIVARMAEAGPAKVVVVTDKVPGTFSSR